VRGLRRLYEYIESRWGKATADKVVYTTIAVLFAVWFLATLRALQ
jgi:hypothetical protein